MRSGPASESTSHRPAPTFEKEHPARLGPALQPHQLSVASTSLVSKLKRPQLAETSRLKRTIALPATAPELNSTASCGLTEMSLRSMSTPLLGVLPFGWNQITGYGLMLLVNELSVTVAPSTPLRKTPANW